MAEGQGPGASGTGAGTPVGPDADGPSRKGTAEGGSEATARSPSRSAVRSQELVVVLSALLVVATSAAAVVLAITSPSGHRYAVQGLFLAGLIVTLPAVIRSHRSIVYRLALAPDPERLFAQPGMEMTRVTNQLGNTSALFGGIALATLAFVLSRSNPSLPNTVDALLGVGLMLGSFVIFSWAFALLSSASVPSDHYRLRAIAFRRGVWLLTTGLYTFYAGLVWTLGLFDIYLVVVAAIAYAVVYSVVMLASMELPDPTGRSG